MPAHKAPKLERVCRGCGKTIRPESNECLTCSVGSSTERLVEGATVGRIVGHSPKALAKEGES